MNVWMSSVSDNMINIYEYLQIIQIYAIMHRSRTGVCTYYLFYITRRTPRGNIVNGRRENHRSICVAVLVTI